MPTITKGLGQISIIDLTDGYTVSLDQTAGSFQSDDTYTAIDLTTQFSVNITVLQGGTVMSGVKIGSCIIKDRNGTQITDGSITALATGGVSPIIIQVHGGNHAHPFTGEMATVTIPVYVEGDPLTPAPSTDVIINKIFTISASVMGESGRSSYTHIKYAEDNQGTNMNSQPSSTRPYIGINISESPTPSVIPGDYAPWTKYLGEDGQPGINVQSTTYYYLLIPSTASAPPKPTTSPPETYTTEGYSGWSETEPIYISGDTRKLYVTVRTVYAGGTFEYSQPSLSSSYEAAKQAYTEAETALSLAGDTNQYFWEQPSSYSADIPAGIYVTHKPQTQFKGLGGPTEGNILIQDTGITIRNGAIPLASLTGSALNFYNPSTHQANATLSSNGLVLSKGGIIVGTIGANQGIYISTENLGNVVSSLVPTPSGGIPKTDWRAIIGSKFGVDSEGNLYANNANITGAITATSFTIGTDPNTAYNGIAAINISGYDIQIVEDSTGVTDVSEGTNLYPYLYHNGEDITSTVTDFTDFLWYQDDDIIGTSGDSTDGHYYATYGHRYRVIYDFDDGAVGGGTIVQTREIDPAKYITKISDTGITIHPEDTTNNDYIQLNGNGLNIYKNNISIAEFGSSGVRIGLGNTRHTLVDSDGMKIYANTSNVIGHIGYGTVTDENGYTKTGAFYTLGYRGSSSVGERSCVFGYGSAIGADSVAESGGTARGIYSHAEGRYCEANADYSHAEGSYCVVEDYDDGQGNGTNATNSHAEGNASTAQGLASHAEGRQTIARGAYSHSQNLSTIASSYCQTSLGKYNEEDDQDIYAIIVGNGTAVNARSNALTVDWNGNQKIQGSLTLGEGTADEVTITAAQLNSLLALL